MFCSPQVSPTKRVDLRIQIATVGETSCKEANPSTLQKEKKIIAKTAGMEITFYQPTQ